MKFQTFLLLVLLAASCAPAPEPTPGPDTAVTSPPGGSAPTNEPATDPLAPGPGDVDLGRGEVYLESASLLIRESYPPQIALTLTGELPTPCHQLRAALSPPDPENKIIAEVYSVVDPEQVCIQVLEPFEETLNLGTFPTGHYAVWVNGKLAGEFAS